MANFFTTKGELVMPYDIQVLERVVGSCGGKMKPGCKFRCTMHGTENSGFWSLFPCVFRAKYVSLDDGIHIKYRVMPGLLVWLLMLLPVAVMTALMVMNVAVEMVGAFGAIIGVVYFAYTFQRGKAVARFEKKFSK